MMLASGGHRADTRFRVPQGAVEPEGIRAGSSSVALRVLEHIFHGLYLALPMIHAYGKQTEGINTSLRVLHGDWKYPLYSLGYVLVLTAFCYFVALFALQRKRHI